MDSVLKAMRVHKSNTQGLNMHLVICSKIECRSELFSMLLLVFCIKYCNSISLSYISSESNTILVIIFLPVRNDSI